MDKSWIRMPRTSKESLIGLNQFLEFAFKNEAIRDRIKYPCPQGKWQTRDVVFDHLIWKPFPQNYINCVMHGKTNVLQNSKSTEVIQDTIPSENPVELFISEAFQGLRQKDIDVYSS